MNLWESFKFMPSAAEAALNGATCGTAEAVP
jgi:hypothetical protein